MEMIIPTLIIFLLAFTGLSIGILFGRKGISGSCSSNEAKLLDIQCFCGQDDNCPMTAGDGGISIKAVCTGDDIEKCKQMVSDFEEKTQKLIPPS
ncbi:MAG: hypothetical protein U9R69_03605 [Thermodesulfobacteriota bacterium]|nr:hypothetical protein [Thermodesulfobacteriota bacterium]